MSKISAFTPLTGDDYNSITKWLSENAATKAKIDKALSDNYARAQLQDKIDLMERDSKYYSYMQEYASKAKEQQAQLTAARAIALSKERDPLRRAEISLMDGKQLSQWYDARAKADKLLAESPTFQAIKHAESPQGGYEAGVKTIHNIKAKTGKLLGDEDRPIDNITGALLNSALSIPLKTITAPLYTMAGNHYKASYIYGLLAGHKEKYGGGDEGGVAKAFQNKEYDQVFERAAISLAEFAPTMAMAIANPLLAGGVSGTSSGFEKYNRLIRENPDVDRKSATISAATTGVVNAALIALSSKYILKSTLGKSALLEKSVIKKLIEKQVAEVTGWAIPIAMAKGAATMATKSLIGVSSDYLTDVALGLREYDQKEFFGILQDTAIDAAIAGGITSGLFATYGYLKVSALKRAADRVNNLDGKVEVEVDEKGNTVYRYGDLSFKSKSEAESFEGYVKQTKIVVAEANAGYIKEGISKAKAIIRDINSKYPEANRSDNFNKLILLNARLIDELSQGTAPSGAQPQPTGQDIVPAGEAPVPPVVPEPMPVPPGTTTAPPAQPIDIDPTAETEILREVEGRKGVAAPPPAPKPKPVTDQPKPEKPQTPKKSVLTKEEEEKTRKTLFAVATSAVPKGSSKEQVAAIKLAIKEAIVSHVTGGKKSSYRDLSPEEKALVYEALSSDRGDGTRVLGVSSVSKEIHDVIETTIKGFAPPHPEPKPEPKAKPKTKPVTPLNKPKPAPSSGKPKLRPKQTFDLPDPEDMDKWSEAVLKLSDDQKRELLNNINKNIKLFEEKLIPAPSSLIDARIWLDRYFDNLENPPIVNLSHTKPLQNKSVFDYVEEKDLPSYYDEHIKGAMSRVFNNPREVKREYGWGVKEIEVDIHSPLDSNIGETEYTFLNETKKAYYDKSLVDKDGKIIDGRYTPLAEHPVLNSTDVSETKMWRGISAAEMSSINDTGEVKSFGDMNFESQVGKTSTATHPAQALSYATHFAAWYDQPTFQRPAYVIEMNRTKNTHDGMSGELEVDGGVPVNEITRVFELRIATEVPSRLSLSKDRLDPTYRLSGITSSFKVYVVRELPESEWKKVSGIDYQKIKVAQAPQSTPQAPKQIVKSGGTPITLYHGGTAVSSIDPSYHRNGIIFFTPDEEVAKYYGQNGHILKAHIAYSKMLNLTNPYDRAVRDFINSYAEEYDEWIDRRSGEAVSVYDLLDSGTLHDYEGTGSGNRWYNLFAYARNMGYDLVVVNDVTIGTDSPSYVLFDPANVIQQSSAPLSADISPYTDKPLSPEEIKAARADLENKLSAIPSGLYSIEAQKGLYKNYDTGEIDIEPSFHVVLKTDEPKYVNAFVGAMREYAKSKKQQSFILTKYYDDSDLDIFSKTGENGGQVTPGIYIKFDSPLNEEQKMIVAKLATEKGLAGLSIFDNGSFATAYDAGDLYGTEAKDFLESATAFAEAIADDEGGQGIKGTVESYAQETWAYTTDPRRSGAGSYAQLERYSKDVPEGQTVLGFKNPHTRLIDTSGLKGKELSLANINNAMASSGMSQEVIDATIAITEDIVERLANSVAPGLNSDDLFEQFFSCIQYVDENIEESTISDMLKNMSSGSIPDADFHTEINQRLDRLMDMSKTTEGVSGSADIRKLITTKRNDVVGQGLTKMLVYELIQNSVDAGAKNVEFYEITPGYIEALKDKLSPLAALANLNLLPDSQKLELASYTHVIVADDGSGMSPDDVKTKLLRVGNTGKGKDKSGAYGIAKTGFILGTEMFQVITVKDGVMTELTTNFDMYMESMEPGGKQMKLNIEKTDLPNGTVVNIVYDNQNRYMKGEVYRYAELYSGKATLSYTSSKVSSAYGRIEVKKEVLPTAKDTVSNPLSSSSFEFEGNKYDITLHETNIGTEAREAWPQYIVTTHGLPVYATPGIYGVRWFGRGDVKVFINFTKLNPDPESNNYPFINNRTQLAHGIARVLEEQITKIISEAKQKNVNSAVEELIGSIKNGIKIDSNTMFVLPGNDQSLKDDIKKHVKTHIKVYKAFSNVISLFHKYVSPAFPEETMVGIGYSKGVGGWRPDERYQPDIKKAIGKEFFAVNLFNCLEDIYSNRIANKAVMMMKDPEILLARELVMVMCHEACHKYGSDVSAEFSYAVCDLPVAIGYEALANFQDEVYYELFKGSKSVSINDIRKAGDEVAEIFARAGSTGGISQKSNVLGSRNDGNIGLEKQQDVNRREGKSSIPNTDRGIQRDYSKAEDTRVIRGLAFTSDKTGKFHIALGKDLDATTGIHELAHAYEKALALAATKDKKAASIYNRLSSWLGASPHNWNQNQREQFVSGFMTTLYKGVNRGGIIGEVYSRMQKLISEVWDNMSENPAIDLDPEIKAIYDSLFGVETDAEIFNKDDISRAKSDSSLIIPNGTRGSPLINVFTTPSKSYITHRFGHDSYSVVYKGDGKSIPVSFIVHDNGDFLTIDGMNCHNYAQISARVAQIANSAKPTNLSSVDFHTDTPGSKKIVESSIEDQEAFFRDAQKHIMQLINSLRGKFDVAKLRTSVMNVLSDTIVIKLGTDPVDTKGSQKYNEYVHKLTGRSKLQYCTTLELVKALEIIDPGTTKAFFSSNFFDVIPKLVKRMQHEFNDFTEQGEEDMLLMIGNLMKNYSSEVIQSSGVKLNAFRMANVLISKMGKEGKEVLSRVSSGKNWSERMAGHGSEIIYEIKELFMNHRNSNKLGEPYYLEHQKIAGAIVKSAIEQDFESEVRGISQDEMPTRKLPPLTEEQHKLIDALRNEYIKKAVQQNNRNVRDGKSTGRTIHPDDVIKFKDLILEFNGYYETQIMELNKMMGTSVIGLRKNYIMNVLEGIASDQASGLVKEGRGEGSIKDLLGEPPWVKKYEGAEGVENTDYVPILTSYNASMAKYIAFYPTIHYINNVLPLDVSQTFNTGYEDILFRYLKGIMGYASPRRGIDRFISLARTNVTSVALSWRPSMIALNFIQRHLSAVFVNPTVWAEANKMVNVFSGRLRNPDKHPNLASAHAILQTGGKNLYEEQIEKWRRLDIDRELSTFIRAFRKSTRLAEFNLQNSGFMATERGNWGFSYVAGVLQAVMSSKQYVEALKSTGDNSKAIEIALDDPKVFERALVSGMVVNASTNCDPSPVFSPQYFTKNNSMANLLWFLRFGINHAEIMLNDANPFINNKSNWSQGIFRSIVYGDESQANEATRLMVMNNIVDMLSPANMKVVFKHEDKYNNRFSREDMKRAYQTAKMVRDEYRKNLHKPQHGYFRLSGKTIVLNSLIAFLGYTVAEFLIQYWTRRLMSLQNKTFGEALLPDEAAKRKVRQGEDNVLLESALGTANLTRFVTSPTLAAGLMPDINRYNMTSGKAWTRAGVRYGVTQIAPIGVPSSIMQAITGVSIDEMIVEELYREQK